METGITILFVAKGIRSGNYMFFHGAEALRGYYEYFQTSEYGEGVQIKEIILADAPISKKMERLHAEAFKRGDCYGPCWSSEGNDNRMDFVDGKDDPAG
jgi:hypothetical protein